MLRQSLDSRDRPPVVIKTKHVTNTILFLALDYFETNSAALLDWAHEEKSYEVE
jgi:hypothetical protein